MSRFTITIAIAITLLAGTALTFNGDHHPWCEFPSLFPGTLKASPAFIDPTKDLEGEWYTLGYKKQDWKYCQCSMQVYKWNAEKDRIDTWFGCETEKDQMYTDVTLHSKNANNSKFGGWMRFSKDGWFWVPFNFWILDIAADKSWFVVGEPCRSMAFFVSRTKSVPDAVYQAVKDRLQIKHKIDISDFVPKCEQEYISK